jgi:UDP-N-acetylmuramoyl-L-alanyl-D-glutamate--2,6-diaminopimelate ligase
VRLVELIQDLPVTPPPGLFGAEARGLSHDSRKILPGDLFVALAGARQDGRSFALDAVRRGALAVLGQGSPPAGLTVPWLQASEDPRGFLGTLAARVYDHPDRDLLTVGVTGTNGKTTVASLMRSLLEASGRPAGILGTLGYRFQGRSFGEGRTTPEATDLFRILRAMREAGARAAAFEVTSHALELGRVQGARFDLAIFTNLTRDHLDFHGDFESYYRAKKKLFDLLKAGGQAVVGVGDAYGQRLAEELRAAGQKVLTFGSSGDVRLEEAQLTPEGIRGRLRSPEGEFPLASPLVGRFNLENLEAAAAGALALGLEPEAIERAFATLEPLPGRFEPVTHAGSGIRAFVDYAHTEAALEAALEAVRELSPAQLIVVFGCGGDRDRGKRATMGRIAGRLADLAIATSDNPRTEEPLAILATVEEGLRDSGGAYRIVPDRRQAIREAVKEAGDEALVLVAGKGAETYQEIGTQVLPFSDREELLAALEARTHGTAAS